MMAAGKKTSYVLMLSGLTSLIAAAAFAFAIVSFNDQLSVIQRSRQASATDTCYLFRKIVIAATIISAGRRKIAVADHFLETVGLSDCRQFGINVRKGVGIPGVRR